MGGNVSRDREKQSLYEQGTPGKHRSQKVFLSEQTFVFNTLRMPS